MIKQITVIMPNGIRQYEVGLKCPINNVIIHSIKITPLMFTGDPFDHYVGFSESGNILFSIYPLSPVDVIFS